MQAVPLHAAATLALLLGASPLGAQDAPVDFAKEIRPVFERRCFECHGAKKQKGGLRLDRRDGVFGSEDPSDWVVVPKQPSESLLLDLVSLPADDVDRMPPKGDPLSAAEIALLRQWIEEGAEWPTDADAPAEAPEAGGSALVIAPLEGPAAERAAAALEAVRGTGGLGLVVAANTAAVDVNFSLRGEAVKDEQLASLAGLEPVLVWLNLSRTGVSDAGLRRLAAFGELRRLNLSRTEIGDAGLAHLSGLKKLEVLNLYGTKVGDEGLASLRGLTGLKRLYLWKTGVTDAGAAALREALPQLHIDRGDYVLEDPKPVEASSDNAKCPVSGKDVDPTIVVEHEGLKVGFCCDQCRAAFLGEPAKYIGKVREEVEAKRKTSAPVNDVCPVSGKAVDPAMVVVHGGETIAFCCGNCKAAFEKEPGKFLGALVRKQAAEKAKEDA